MKLGLTAGCAPRGWPLERLFQTAKAAGFDGVECSLTENGAINLQSTREDMGRVRALAAAAGIELYSITTGLYWIYSLTSDDEQERQKANSIVAKQLEIASWLGCDTVLVVPGAVGVDFAPNLPVVPYNTAYERALDAIRAAAPLAETLGVTIGVENVLNKLLLSPLEMRDFIDKCESGFVGAYFDVGNTLPTGYPEHWIKILGGRIKKVHFKDFCRATGNLSGFVPLLCGDVDYPAVMDAFRAVGYDGWVTSEVLCGTRYPEVNMKNTANAMKAIVGGKISV